MVDSMTSGREEFEVVWHGGMANDPLGGLTKGCLLEPREQTEDERQQAFSGLGQGDNELTLAELDRAVARLNASLKRPLAWTGIGGSK